MHTSRDFITVKLCSWVLFTQFVVVVVVVVVYCSVTLLYLLCVGFEGRTVDMVEFDV